MCDCKNIGCDKTTKEGKDYCSLKCRNVYFNKYERDYSKIKDKKNERIEKYLKEPKLCKNCNSVIDYEKKRNSFCSNTCSTTFNNKGRKHKEETKAKISKTVKDKELYLNTIKGDNEVIKKQLMESKTVYYESPKLCNNCGETIKWERRNEYQMCDMKCREEYYEKNSDPKKKYSLDCRFKFNLADYEDEFDFTLVEKYGWYKPTNRGDNLEGVSRDHMYSVSEGFKNNVDPKLISHPANCKLMKHEMNFKKHTKCSITLEELEEKIKAWNRKYEK